MHYVPRILPALALLALAGCGSRAAPPPAPPTPPPPDPEILIAQALADAEVAEPDEVVHDLIALVPERDDLVWEPGVDAGAARVLLVAWTTWDGYAEQVGQTVPLGRTLWVSAAPEVHELCRASGLDGEDLDRRLEQYLGLRPDTAKTHFLELWVAPADTVRPCPDPEVTDTACEATDQAADVVIGTHDHRPWFDDLRARSYGPDGYPWTRLGYTYDWSPDTPERGASEFLVPEGAMVTVVSYTPTHDYCNGTGAGGKAARTTPRSGPQTISGSME